MDGQKYKHPGIRRASWNPEVAENVAGRLIPKPRKGQPNHIISVTICQTIFSSILCLA